MKKLNQFDYQALGLKDRWNVGELVDVLTDIEMEVGAYFHREDASVVYEKIYNKYWAFVVRSLFQGHVPYTTYYSYEAYNNLTQSGADPDKSIREYNTELDRELFFKYAESDNRIKIDFGKLNRFLCGDEVPEPLVLELEPSKEKFERVARVDLGKSPDEEVSYSDKPKGEEHPPEKKSTMWKYAFDIGVFCKENANDDYVPKFEDVCNYMAIKYGANTVPDSWVKEILAYAPNELRQSDGRPRKLLTDAIKTGFHMREWFDENENISELQFKEKCKLYLNKVSDNIRAKSWDYINKLKQDRG